MQNNLVKKLKELEKLSLRFAELEVKAKCFAINILQDIRL